MALTFISQLIKSDEAGFACSKSKLVAKDGVVHLRPFNINEKGQLDLAEAYMIPVEEAPQSKLGLNAGDILFNNTNSVEWVGKSALIRADIPHAFSNHMNRVRVDQNRVMPAWFHYWLEEKRKSGFFSANCTQWVSQAAYRLSSLNNTQIDLPPLDEQHRIVDILDRAASIQRLRQAADEKLKEIIPALFIDMFGDPASNPKGWPMTTVGDLIESADYGSSSKAHDEATGLPMLRMGNVTVDGALDLKNLKYVELEPAEQAKFTLRKGDILFNRTNSKELVGKTGIWDGSCDAVFASYFIRLRTKPDVMTAEVLWAFMNSKHTKGLLFGMARGAIGQSNINSKELRAIRLFAPPIALQERFSQLYYDLKAKAEMSTAATTAAKSIAASLANDVFSAA